MPDLPPLPDWVQTIRPTQLEAVEEIVYAFDHGADVVMLDAPTGAGKTLIAELVRRGLAGTTPSRLFKSLYVCNTIGLQEQFLRDFPYATLVKGRSNYLPVDPPMVDYTCADCLGRECDWCTNVDGIRLCPYEIASGRAEMSPLTVTNTSYFINAANHARKLQDRDLVICDESDTLEGILTGFIEFKVSRMWLEKLKLNPPKKGSHFTTVKAWVAGEFDKALKDYSLKIGGAGEDTTVEQVRERKQLANLYAAKQNFLATEGEWIRDNDAGPMVYKPITVGPWGAGTLWQHGKKWLCMSGSIVSMSEQVRSLGAGELDVRLVTVPMAFPKENRPIVLAPVADMSYKNTETAWPVMANAIGQLLRMHPGERVLVHCVSYKLAEYLHDHVQSPDRYFYSYTTSQGKDHAFQEYSKWPDSVLFAPSMDRGFDFKEDLARVVIVAKVPFPSLGDKQVGARMHEPGGQEWYNVQTVRTVLQMTGRGVRSETDHATTYLLDSQFQSTLWAKAKSLFPQWWRDGIVRGFDWRKLREPLDMVVDVE